MMEVTKFFFSEFDIDNEFMRQGGAATVYKALHYRLGEVALKQWYSYEKKNEIELLTQNITHPNIIRFLGMLMHNGLQCIGYIMPYMSIGSLEDGWIVLDKIIVLVIHNNAEKYDEKQVSSWITQICRAISHLHFNKIIHRNIKPSDVLLGKCYDEVKLCNFRMAKSLKNTTGTLTEGFDQSVKIPYDQIERNVWMLLEKVAKGERPELNDNLSKEVSDLLTRCWDADPSKRPTIDNVLQISRSIKFKPMKLEITVEEVSYKKYTALTINIKQFFISEFKYNHETMKLGGQACVFKSSHSVHGVVAIKKFCTDHYNKAVYNEAIYNENAHHPNIVQFIGILSNKESKWIGYIMPYMSNGSLDEIIHDKEKKYDNIYTSEQITSWITQVCYGLIYLHSTQIIHRDIKPSNILLGKSFDDVKLADFGIARSLENITGSLTAGMGTMFYMAPEVIQGGKYNIIPFDHVKYPNMFVLSSKISDGQRPELQNDLSEELSSFLARCWHADASQRPQMNNVLEFCSTMFFRV